MCSLLGGGATAKAEDRVGALRWRGEAMDSSLGDWATAEAKGRADGTRRDLVAREVMCSSQARGATVEASGYGDGAPRGLLARRIV